MSVGERLGWITVSLTLIVLGVVIGTLNQALGTATAVQWTVAVTGVTRALLGAVCVMIATGAPPVEEMNQSEQLATFKSSTEREIVYRPILEKQLSF